MFLDNPGGKRGHPVLLRTELVPEIVARPADSSLRDYVEAKGYMTVEVEDEGILWDVDTPEDYEMALARANGTTAEVWHVVEATVGQTVACVHLVAYKFRNEVTADSVLLQLSFVDGSVLFLDGAGDGESLRARPSPWVDPFAGKLAPVNEEFVRTHGQWVLLNMSGIEPFKLLIGQPIRSVHPILNQAGTLSGVEFSIAGQCLSFSVECDECHILWSQHSQGRHSDSNHSISMEPNRA